MLQTIFIVFLKMTYFCNKMYCPLDWTTLSNVKNWSFSMKKIWCKLSNSWNFYKENPNLFSKLIQFQSKLNSFFKQKSLDFQTILKVFLNLGAILKLRWQDFRDFRPPLPPCWQALTFGGPSPQFTLTRTFIENAFI